MPGRSGVILDRISAVATIVAATAVLGTIVWERRPNALRQDGSHVQVVEGIETTEGQFSLGAGTAKVEILEYSDFQCPYCGRYARETFPRLRAEFVDPGRVRYSFHHYPLEAVHKAALRAGMVAVCAGEQGVFWPMHDWLFRNQAALEHDGFWQATDVLTLDVSGLDTCLSSAGNGVIQRDQEEAAKFSITGTPSFLVGTVGQNGRVKVFRRISGAQPFEVFRSAIEDVSRMAHG
jgi:protein-disulfide isomerase